LKKINQNLSMILLFTIACYYSKALFVTLIINRSLCKYLKNSRTGNDEPSVLPSDEPSVLPSDEPLVLPSVSFLPYQFSHHKFNHLVQLLLLEFLDPAL
jgi:hypothetical protein